MMSKTQPPRNQLLDLHLPGQDTPASVVPPAAAAAPPLSHACVPAASADVSGTPSSTGAGAGPRPSSRLIGIDAARGVALVGMIAVHNISATDADGQLSLAWSLAAGKSAALFALLAGVGIAFATGRRRRPHGRRWTAEGASLVVRALIIGAVGLLLGYLVPSDYAAVILPYYALLFLFAIPLLALSIRALVATAAVITVAVPVLSHLLRAGTDLVSVPNPTFGDLLENPAALLTELALTGAYPALPWMAYLCAGLAVGRAALSSRLTVGLLALIGVTLVAAATMTSWVLLDVAGGRARLEASALQSMTPEEFQALLGEGAAGITPADTGWWLATMVPHSSTPVDIAYTIGVALVVLAICILIGRASTAVLRPLAAAGSMTLTLYSAHLLMLSSPDVPGGVRGFLIHVAVVVAFALLWSRYHPRGPLEEIVATVTGAVRSKVLTTGSVERSGARRPA